MVSKSKSSKKTVKKPVKKQEMHGRDASGKEKHSKVKKLIDFAKHHIKKLIKR
ncbi:MAG: hypothetical protein AABX38_07855 [Candidatus Micrarchaeota archaeon]